MSYQECVAGLYIYPITSRKQREKERGRRGWSFNSPLRFMFPVTKCTSCFSVAGIKHQQQNKSTYGRKGLSGLPFPEG